MKKRIPYFFLLVLLMVVFSIGKCESVYGKSPRENQEEVQDTEIDEMLGELNLGELDAFTKKEDTTAENRKFSALVRDILDGTVSLDFDDIFEYIGQVVKAFFSEYKMIFVNVMACSLIFAILYLFSKNFQNTFLSEIEFFCIYGMIMLLMMRKFAEMGTVIGEVFQQAILFMQLFIPTYCMAMSFSMKSASAAVVYSMTLGWISILEFLVLKIILPMIRVYAIFEFLNYLQEETRFEKITELLYGGIRFALKGIVAAVGGIQVIQAMILPAVDQMKGMGILRTVSVVPGVGNALQASGQLLIGSAVVIKNAVGVAGIYFLVVLLMAPFLKSIMMTVVFQALAALTEPITDKRIAGGVSGIAKGAGLYMKVIETGILLFLITIAITAVSTNQIT